MELGIKIGKRRTFVLAGIIVCTGLIVMIAWAVTPSRHQAIGSGGRGRGEMTRAIPVRATAATTGSVDVTVTALGSVTALNTVTIHTRVDGPLISVPFHEGQLVKAGDVLARIDPRTFKASLDQAEGQLARDRSQLAGARIDLDRYRDLLSKDSIQRQQVDDQQAMVRQLEGTVHADQAAVDSARLQLEFTRITAPFDGRVGLRQVDPGNMVHATDTTGLVVLTQTHPIYVVFAVPAEHLSEIYPRYRTGENMTVDALDGSGKVLAEGSLVAIDNQIDPTTGTVKAKGQFANTDDVLFPSQFVNARLKIQTLSGVTLAPSAAVQRGAPGTFVYVVNQNDSVSLRKVTLGPVEGDLVTIDSGVRAGERVVTDGIDKLRDGAFVSIINDTQNPATVPAQPGNATQHRRTGSGGSAMDTAGSSVGASRRPGVGPQT